MNNKFTLLIFLIFLNSPVLISQDTDAIYQYGWQLIASEDYVLAIDQFDLLSDFDSEDYRAWYGKGISNYHLKYFNESIKQLEYVNELNPDWAEAYFYLGRIHIEHRNFITALPYFQEAFYIDTLLPEINYFIGACIYETDASRESFDYLSSSINQNPTHAYSNYYLSRIYLDKQSIDTAYTYINEALKTNPHTPRFWMQKGDISYSNLAVEESILQYTQAISQNPNYIDALIHRGIAYLETSKYLLALDDFEKANGLQANNEYILLNKSLCEFALEKYPEAINTYTQIINIAPENIDLLYRRGLAYLYTGQFDLALEDFSLLSDVYPDDSDLHFQIGNCYQLNDNHEMALKAYTVAISLNNNHYRAFNNKAVVLHNLGESEKACEKWKQLSNCDSTEFRKLAEENLKLYCH